MNRDMNQDNQNDRRRNQRPDRNQMPSRNQMPGGPGMPGAPMMPPPGFAPQGPAGAPRMAPPSFIPEPPGMEGYQRGGPMGFGQGYMNQSGRRDIRRCINNFMFIWLRNGSSFWFYPINYDRQFIQGFRWRGNRWEYDFINLNRIMFYRCFNTR